MRNLKRFAIVPATILMGLCLMTGCGQKYTELDCPFTTLDWTATLDDVLALEGSDYVTEASYYGTAYEFVHEYDGLEGIIKYTVDEKERLTSVAWIYTSEDMNAVTDEYDRIHSSLEAEYGVSGYQTTAATNLGDDWYREEGNIMVVAVTTETYKAVQYSYLSPSVSNDEPEASTEKTNWNDLPTNTES